MARIADDRVRMGCTSHAEIYHPAKIPNARECSATPAPSSVPSIDRADRVAHPSPPAPSSYPHTQRDTPHTQHRTHGRWPAKPRQQDKDEDSRLEVLRVLETVELLVMTEMELFANSAVVVLAYSGVDSWLATFSSKD